MTSKMLQSSNTYMGTDPPLVNDPKDPTTMIWPTTLLIKIETATQLSTPLKLAHLLPNLRSISSLRDDIIHSTLGALACHVHIHQYRKAKRLLQNSHGGIRPSLQCDSVD